MALIKAWKDPTTGIEFPQAYHRVIAVVVDNERKAAQFSVCVYRDQEARTSGLRPMEFATMNFMVSQEPDPMNPDAGTFNDLFSLAKQEEAGVNVIKQAYVWLKTHVRYIGAVDA